MISTLVLYLVVALGISFLCSLLEAVILSVTQTHIALLIKTNHRSGRLLKRMKDNVDRSLSGILTLNTMAHTIGAAGVGSESQKLFGDEKIALTSGLLTFLILFLSEIIPKTVGVTYWRRLAPPSAYLIQLLIWITFPLVLFFEFISKFITHTAPWLPRMSRDEMIVAAELGQSEGTLVEKETRIIRNLLGLNRIYVSDVMTPKKEVFAFQATQTVGEVMEKHGHESYSRVPVYGKNLDDVVGMVLRFHIFNADSDGHSNLPMEVLMQPIHKVRGSQTLARILDEFIQRHEHMFLVIDERGNTIGIITLEDAIETLLGVEIEDEIDSVEKTRERILEQWRTRLKK